MQPTRQIRYRRSIPRRRSARLPEPLPPSVPVPSHCARPTLCTLAFSVRVSAGPCGPTRPISQWLYSTRYFLRPIVDCSLKLSLLRPRAARAQQDPYVFLAFLLPLLTVNCFSKRRVVRTNLEDRRGFSIQLYPGCLTTQRFCLKFEHIDTVISDRSGQIRSLTLCVMYDTMCHKANPPLIFENRNNMRMWITWDRSKKFFKNRG